MAVIGAVMFGGFSAGVACSSGGKQTVLDGSGGHPLGGLGGSAGSIGGGVGGSAGGESGTGGGAGSGGGGGLACAATALTNCTGTMSGPWCVDQFLQSDPVEADFQGIWAASATDVWAVGFARRRDRHPQQRRFHLSLGRLRVDAGAALDPGRAQRGVGRVRRRRVGRRPSGHGRALERQRVDAVSTGTTSHFWAVSGTAANDVWAVGDGGAFHWNGSAWTASPGFPIPPAVTNFDGDVWAVAPNDVWVVGNRNLLTRFNGTTWTTTPVSTDTTHSLFGVWSDGSNGWAVGEGDQIQKFAGGAWTTIQGAGGSSVGFLDVMAVGADVWAVGQSIVHATGGGAFQQDTDAPPPPYANFDGLWMTATQVWAAGSALTNGAPTIIHRAR